MTTTRSVSYTWRLREVMAAQGVWKTTDLLPLLAERGVTLSTAQVYRMAARVPERISLPTLAALCDIFSCSPSDLIGVSAGPPPRPGEGEPPPIDMAARRRPRRARVDPNR
jgi:DNA-binding Xre family transcriptional regulator